LSHLSHFRLSTPEFLMTVGEIDCNEDRAHGGKSVGCGIVDIVCVQNSGEYSNV